MTGVAAFLAWVTALMALGAIVRVERRVEQMQRDLRPLVCTHGASSVGPVTIRGGHLTGNTTPTTEPCLR